MPSPPLAPSFSWQFIPQPPTMKHVRNTGRNLKRWGKRLGFRAGTTDAEKAQILACRWIHLFCAPHTASSDVDFTNESGKPTTGYILPAEREWQPYTLLMLAPFFTLALKGLVEPPIPDNTWHDWMKATDDIRRFTGANQFRGPVGRGNDFVAPLFRAICTVHSGFVATQENATDYIHACDYWQWPLATMLPLVATKPWQIASMPGGTTIDEADWGACPFNTQFMVA